MPNAFDLLREGRKEELWQRCCGFIDLTLEEFMEIQYRLLREQIELLKNCELGRKVRGLWLEATPADPASLRCFSAIYLPATGGGRRTSPPQTTPH